MTTISEKQIQQDIFKKLGSRFDIRLFRNNVGTAWMGDVTRMADGSILIRNPRRVVFGLHKGSSDLIGWHQVTITPEMVGKKIARFVALEVKTRRGTMGPMQKNFVEVVKAHGGAAGMARSADEAMQIIGGDDGLDL